MYLWVRFETKNPGIYDAPGGRSGSETFEAIWLSIEQPKVQGKQNYDIRLTTTARTPGKKFMILVEMLIY